MNDSKFDRSLLIIICAAMLFIVGATIRSCRAYEVRLDPPIQTANHWGYR